MRLFSFGLGALGGSPASAALTRMREHRPRPSGVADLLPYVSFASPRTLVTKSGSFLSAWEYRGPDLASASPADLAQLTSHVNDALLSLGDGWVLHVDANRLP